MSGFTVEAIDEMGVIHDGLVKLAGAQLGVESCGMQVLDFPGGFERYPEHGHSADGMEEVYAALRGSAEPEVDGERVAIDPSGSSGSTQAPGAGSFRGSTGCACWRPAARSASRTSGRRTSSWRRSHDRATDHRGRERSAALVLGTLARIRLDAEQTDGRFALWEGELPHGAAPPLHSHPQDEIFCVLDGQVIVWIDDRPHACRRGAVVFAAGGVPHAFRVESDTARMLFLSTPAGIEDFIRELAEPAQWPWLQPPPDGPRISPERIEEVEQAFGVVRHGPSPPPASGS